jgi:RNA polymerase sigma factor (sigma-70 family)
MTPNHFTQLVNTYSDRVFRYIVKQGINRLEAEDLVQNCFEALWKSSLENEEECGKYLFGVAYNQCVNHWRKSGREKLVDQIPDYKLQTNEKSNWQSVLHQAMLQLPAEIRQLILLKDYEGYSYKEIEEMTKYSEAQVKVYLHRARKELQQIIGTQQQQIQ